jgi:hypothetical protein
MITLQKNILILLLLCLLGVTAKSQESFIYHRNFVGVSLTELFFTDFRISYERRIDPSGGIKLEFSYRPYSKTFTDATNINLGQNATAWCYGKTARWYYGSIGYRYYHNPKKTSYLSAELFYKLLSADKIVYSYAISYGDSQKNTYEVRTMNTNIAGINLLAGKRISIKFSEGYNMGFDIFTGLTMRYKNINTLTYGRAKHSGPHDSLPGTILVPMTDNPLEDKTNLFQVCIQFGVVLFASWK